MDIESAALKTTGLDNARVAFADVVVQLVAGGERFVAKFAGVLVLSGKVNVFHVLAQVALVLGGPPAQPALEPAQVLVLIIVDVPVQI